MLSTHTNLSTLWHSSSPLVTFLQMGSTILTHSSLNSVCQITLLTDSVSVSSNT